MRSRALFLSLFFIAFAIASLPLPVHAQTAKNVSGDLATEVLKLVNAHRTAMGLGALKMNNTISPVAEKHSRNMATKKIPFGHDGFDARMKGLRDQLKNIYGWAENVAYGPQTAAEVVDMWLHSPGHKKNIEGDYNITGIGIVKDAAGQPYYTQIFLKQGN